MSNKAQTPVEETRRGDDEYAVRWFHSGDVDGIRSLFAEALDRERSPAAVEWKYRDDPYLSHVPITVAERRGELVGVQAYLPFELRDGDRTTLALQPADAVVHADHRRNGLYSRMTQLAIDRYTAGEPALFFNYPSPGALSAQQDMGWRSLGDLAVNYRVQRPSQFVTAAVDGEAGRALGRAADVVARGGFGLADRLAPSTDDVTVTRHGDVPSELLASLYERDVPEGLHLHRERRFYDWWLANPVVEYATYVARSGGRPAGALVTRAHPSGVLQLREAVPLVGAQSHSVFGRLLSEAIADHPDADVVKSVGSTLPAPLLRRFGFVSDSAPVLDDATTSLHMAVRPLSEDGEGGHGDDATESANWHPTFLEVDRD